MNFFSIGERLLICSSRFSQCNGEATVLGIFSKEETIKRISSFTGLGHDLERAGPRYELDIPMPEQLCLSGNMTIPEGLSLWPQCFLRKIHKP